MKKKWLFYTVAHSKRFVGAAVNSAESFIKWNPDIKFVIFLLDEGDEYNWIASVNDIELKVIKEKDWKTFDQKYLDINKYYDVCFFKFGIAPKYLKEYEADYIGFVDADTLCMRELPLSRFHEDLDINSIIYATDPKLEDRITELLRTDINEVDPHDIFYLNSGVLFWKHNEGFQKLFNSFGLWVKDNIDELSKLPFADQTWLNIFLNNYCCNPRFDFLIYEMGYWWNLRTVLPDERCYIWHPGGRNSEGIENIKKYLEGKL